MWRKKRTKDGNAERGEWDWDSALRSAVQCGLLPDQFWELTPAELNIIIDVYIENKKNEKKSGITAAFYSAYFAKHEKLRGADLQGVLDGIDEGSGQEMSDEEMLSAVRGFAGN
ncbi:MAG: phage tail assembly chaperone [Desulfitobacteriaceae bacterium]